MAKIILPIKTLPDEYLKGLVHKEVYQYKRGTLFTIAGSTHRKTGTGKSWTALKIGEYNDPDYQENADKVVYFVQDFLKVLDRIEETKRYGQVAVIDEAGSMLASDKWQSIVNKAVSYTVQTFRYLRATTVLVMPQRRLIDKNTRTMADYGIVMNTQIHSNRLYYMSTPYAMKYDEYNDMTMRQSIYGRFSMYKKPRVLKLKDVPVSPVVSQELIADYEKKSMAYKKQLRELLADEIKSYDKMFQKDMPEIEIEKLSDSIAKDDELISSMVSNRKLDKDLLAVALEKNYPNYKFNSKNITLLHKMIKKRMMG